jgi:hypothetical protein
MWPCHFLKRWDLFSLPLDVTGRSDSFVTNKMSWFLRLGHKKLWHFHLGLLNSHTHVSSLLMLLSLRNSPHAVKSPSHMWPMCRWPCWQFQFPLTPGLHAVRVSSSFPAVQITYNFPVQTSTSRDREKPF